MDVSHAASHKGTRSLHGPLAREFSANGVMLCFSLLVKCLKNTPAFFAERLNKAMRVRASHVQGSGQGMGGVVSAPPPVTGTLLRAEGTRRATPQPRGQRAHGGRVGQ